MDEITRGGKAFKDAWSALPKDRKRAVSKAVQAGKEVHEETAVAVGYAQRQITTSWLGYIAIIALAIAINAGKGQRATGSSLTWAIIGAIVLIGVYSYWRLFQARARNRELLATMGAAAPTELGDVERLEGEGGPVAEAPESPPPSPPMPPTPSATTIPGAPATPAAPTAPSAATTPGAPTTPAAPTPPDVPGPSSAPGTPASPPSTTPQASTDPGAPETAGGE